MNEEFLRTFNKFMDTAIAGFFTPILLLAMICSIPFWMIGKLVSVVAGEGRDEAE